MKLLIEFLDYLLLLKMTCFKFLCDIFSIKFLSNDNVFEVPLKGSFYIFGFYLNIP